MYLGTSLPDIDEGHCRALTRSFYSYNYDYARSMTTVCFSSTGNRDLATYGTTSHNVDGRRFLKDCCGMFMLDAGHRWRSVKMLLDEDGLDFASEPLCMRYTLRVDNNLVSPAQTIRPSKIANLSIEIV